jgi:hypothetical protein
MRIMASESGKSVVKAAAAALLPAVLLLVLFAVISACSDNWQLFGFGPEFAARGEGAGGWHIYKEALLPTGPVEEAVVQVAQSRQPQQIPNGDVIYIMKDQVFNFVYVVEKDDYEKDGDASWLRKKTFTRYVVADSKIVAKSDRVTEFLGDAEFERAVWIDAGKAQSMDTVLLYYDKAHPATLASRPLGPCAAEVRVFPPDKITSVPLAQKIVTYCSLRLLKPPPHG